MKDDFSANLIGLLLLLLVGVMVFVGLVALAQDCSRRKCLTGTPTFMFREGRCLCVNLPE